MEDIQRKTIRSKVGKQDLSEKHSNTTKHRSFWERVRTLTTEARHALLAVKEQQKWDDWWPLEINMMTPF